MSVSVLHRIVIESPVGALTITASEAGIRSILWPDEHRAIHHGDVVDGPTPLLVDAARQLDEYFAGTRREFDLPLDPEGTPFQHQAWGVLRAIPYGATMSYGEQARALGDPNKARAVGAANGRNPISIVVPCHRVVGSTGKLTGFAAGLDTKAWLLDHERTITSRVTSQLHPS
jgi:methylated-DNA-[protein]-cysteine S-methyltransferase